MSRIDPSGDPEAGRIQLYTRVALFNLLLALLALAVILWIARAERELSSRIAEFREHRAQVCANTRVIPPQQAVLVDPEDKAPPQDPPRNGYIGPRGSDIAAAMRLTVEVLRAGSKQREPAPLRLGSQEVLPSGTIHVVNLWATWCDACREEMPDFRALFSRRPDWGQQVRFVPFMVQDDNDPVRAYQQIVRDMPPSPVMLADRSEGGEFTKTLTSDNDVRLYHEQLPVTLVLDCNRRVRWAQFASLTQRTFVELEKYVDQLRQELADSNPGAWCMQEWCGNGRCEGEERSPSQHCPADCGPVRRGVDAAEAPAEAPAPAECPEGTARTADGQCARKLRGTPAGERRDLRVEELSTCGNDVCDTGESSDNCCKDCGCAQSRVCLPDGEGGFKCARALKGPRPP